MISVIIPTLNEQEYLPQTLAALATNRGLFETIVVDGGSTDETPGIARDAGASLITCGASHRAIQMNLGATKATGDILFFLHADTVVPAVALQTIETAAFDGCVAGGAFERRYDSPSLWLAATCRLASWRSQLFGWHLGDQGIFIRKKVFEAIGGFRPLERFEDLDLSLRMKRMGRTVLLGPPVVSSARRFERHGPVKTSLRDFWLTFQYVTGGPEPVSGKNILIHTR